MAPGRVYRDYMEEDAYETSDVPRRSTSVKAYSDRATSPQTVFLDDQMNGEGYNGLEDIDENSVGVAHTKDDFEDSWDNWDTPSDKFTQMNASSSDSSVASDDGPTSPASGRSSPRTSTR